MNGRLLPQKESVLCVEHDIPLAVGARHHSKLDQNQSGRMFQNIHIAKFEQVTAGIGVHVVQASLHLLSRDDVANRQRRDDRAMMARTKTARVYR